MIWLTWRQSRFSGLIITAILAAIALALAVTHPATAGFWARDHLVQFFGTFLVVVPALIGSFLGAPLVASELETGTHRLAWTQSVTRNRWLAVKIALVGLTAVAATALLSLMLTWWSTPAVNQGRFGTAMFAERGIVPAGYAAFGFALGITAGLLIRRTFPAMATTLAVFVAARVVVQNWIRPHFEAALTRTASLASQVNRLPTIAGVGIQTTNGPLHGKRGDWTISNNIVDASGHVVNTFACNSSSCLAGYHQVLTYQPASRYWTFQGYETALFVSVALILIAFCFWWTRRRLA